MDRFEETVRRIQDVALGITIGHQLGQWSERRWWRHPREVEGGFRLSTDDLLDPQWLHGALQDPPTITTPGWGPTCYYDQVPYICALGMEYVRRSGPLSPEMFRDFLLREREWLRPQAVGRTCVELMAEGMNPRIAGLYAPDVLPGCWIAWPIAVYYAGNADDAFEDAVLLARAQGGGTSVVLTGLLSAMLATALHPKSSWQEVRQALLAQAAKRDERIERLVRQALDAAQGAKRSDDWVAFVKESSYRAQVSKHNVDWLADFYAAVAGLEFGMTRSGGDAAFVRSLLLGCDTRFGVMIGLSLRAALKGTVEFPDAWGEGVAALHRETLDEWTRASFQLLRRKWEDEVQVGLEILPLTEGKAQESTFYDRILAGLLAGAIGNTMGSPVEDRDYPWIMEQYGVLDEIVDPSRLESEDDAAMTKIWAEAYLQCGGRVRAEDLAAVIRDRLDRSGYYYDTQHGYDLLLEGLPAHACGHWNIVTGSGMMGCAPCGMYHAGDPQKAAADARELAYHYQRGFDVHAPAIFCAGVAEALRPGASVDSVLEAAIEAAPEGPLAYFDREARYPKEHLHNALDAVSGSPDVLAVRPPLYARFLEYNGQDPWEVITFTLAVFKVANGDVWQSMLGGTNIGRDSDTIANLSSVLAACISGTSAIPTGLLTLFGDKAMQEYRRLAQGLTDAVAARCRRSLQAASDLGLRRRWQTG